MAWGGQIHLWVEFADEAATHDSKGQENAFRRITNFFGSRTLFLFEKKEQGLSNLSNLMMVSRAFRSNGFIAKPEEIIKEKGRLPKRL
ncbi:hypothetical protein ACLOJK_033515 [Asimina triloba]